MKVDIHLDCYNKRCNFHFGNTCGKDGVTEAKYCRDWKGLEAQKDEGLKRKMVKRFDVKMQVLFCDKHKKVFEETVKVKLSNGNVGIRPSQLMPIWLLSEACLDCKWKTTFGKYI